MSRKSYLEKLRDENNGYNPEDLLANPHLKLISEKRDHLVLEDRESGELEQWTKSSADSEAEYIEKWPRRYAIEFKGKFYYRAG